MKKNRILSLFLIFVLIFNLLPLNVFASEVETTEINANNFNEREETPLGEEVIIKDDVYEIEDDTVSSDIDRASVADLNQVDENLSDKVYLYIDENGGLFFSDELHGNPDNYLTYAEISRSNLTPNDVMPYINSFKGQTTSINIETKISPLNMSYWFTNLTNNGNGVSISGFENIDWSNIKAVYSSGLGLFSNSMFDGTLNVVGNFNELTSIGGLFSGLTLRGNINVTNSIFPSTLSLAGMFNGVKCDEINFENNFVYSNALDNMYSGCLVKKIIFKDCEIPNLETMRQIFDSCSNLEELDISCINTSSFTRTNGSLYNAFTRCTKLNTITLGDNFSFTDSQGQQMGDNGFLPSPAGSTDGKWYNTKTKVGYVPAEIPGNTAATYTVGPIGTDVVLNSDGGILSGESTISVYGEKWGTDLPTPIKDGYTFVGWYDEDGNVITSETEIGTIDDGYTLTAHYIEGNVYVYITDTGVLTFSNDQGNDSYIMEPILLNFDSNTCIEVTSSTGYVSKEPLWYNYRESITSVEINTEIYPETTRNWFAYLGKEELPITIDGLENLRWNRNADAFFMFYNSFIDSNIDLSNIDFSELVFVSNMFGDGGSKGGYIKSINLSNSNFPKVKAIDSMFLYLQTGELNLTNTSFPICTSGTYTFEYLKTDNLKFVNVYLPKITNCYLMFYGSKLDGEFILNKDSFSECINMSGMFQEGEYGFDIDFSELNLSALMTSSTMFAAIKTDKSILLKNIDFDNLTNMGDMFGMASYTDDIITGNVDFSGSTFKVLEKVNGLFGGTRIDGDIIFDRVELPNIKDIISFFREIAVKGDIKLTNMIVGTENGNINMDTFFNCFSNNSHINNIDFTGSHFKGTCNCHSMFYVLRPSGEITFSKGLFENVNGYGMFQGAVLKQNIDLTEVITGKAMISAAFSGTEVFGDVNISGLDITSASGIFSYSKIHGDTILSNIKIPGMSALSGAFYGSNVDGNVFLDKIIFSGTNNISPIFLNATIGSKIDFSGSTFKDLQHYINFLFALFTFSENNEVIFDNAVFPNESNLDNIFIDKSLKKISMKNTSFPNCTSAKNMFANMQASELDLSGLDMPNLIDATGMFQNSQIENNFYISNANFPKCTTVTNMFNGFSSGNTFDVIDNNFTSLTNATDMFRNCNSIRSIDLTSSESTELNLNGAFINTPKLAEVHLGEEVLNTESAFSNTIGNIDNFPQYESMIDRIDGNWYSPNGSSYDLTENNIPSQKAGDYYVISNLKTVFNPLNGTDIKTAEVPYKSILSSAPTVEKTGYTFDSWQTEEGKLFSEYEGKELNSDVEFIAQWTPNQYNVVLDTSGGDLPEGIDNNVSVTYDAKYNNLPIPVKEGYKFVGWYTGLENGEKIDENTDVKITDEQTLYAWYEINNYTVTIDSCNGAEPSIYNIDHGTTIIKPADPEKENYNFVGWYIKDTDTEFNFDEGVKSEAYIEARYDIKKHTVTVDMDNGSDVVTSTVAHGSKIETPEAPSKTGYTFSGWYVKDTDAEFDFNSVITSDTYIIALYKMNSYIVTIDKADGSEVLSYNVNYGSKVDKPELTEREGYTFKSWYIKNTDVEFTFDKEITSNVDIIAKWEIKTYTVTIDTQNDTEAITQKVTYNSLANKPENPVKSGYTFEGWYVDDIEFDFNTPITKDITITAKWDKKSNGGGSYSRPSRPTSPYDDVSRNDYYYDEVMDAINKDYIDPVNNKHFGSKDAINRGETAKLFYKLMSNKPYEFKNKFTDVLSDNKYANEITWADDNTVMIGYGDNKFGPTDSLTREQFALVLWRVYANKNEKYVWAENMIEQAHKVSDWASEAMCWAVSEGIIKGNENGELMPQEVMQRCDVCVIIDRLKKAK